MFLYDNQYKATLQQIFWKTTIFFKNCSTAFLVKSTKTENASLPYKTTISEVNIKTNGMVSKKLTLKNGFFGSYYFRFLKGISSV